MALHGLNWPTLLILELMSDLVLEDEWRLSEPLIIFVSSVLLSPKITFQGPYLTVLFLVVLLPYLKRSIKVGNEYHSIVRCNRWTHKYKVKFESVPFFPVCIIKCDWKLKNLKPLFYNNNYDKIKINDTFTLVCYKNKWNRMKFIRWLRIIFYWDCDFTLLYLNNSL